MRWGWPWYEAEHAINGARALWSGSTHLLATALAELAAAGLPLDPAPFRAIWEWRFPVLLRWREGAAELTIRQALEPWPLLCDTPVEGGSTSRFVDSSLRRFEVVTSAAFRQRYGLVLQGRPLALPAAGASQPVAVRYRLERLYPCLHPTIAPHLPLELALVVRPDGGSGQGGESGVSQVGGSETGGLPLQRWTLLSEDGGFLPQEPTGGEAPLDPAAAPWRGASPDAVTVDLRLP